MPKALIVGAGLTGCSVAYRLASEGFDCLLLERASVPGGLIRSEHLEGVLYEPHGSHIFHTEDEEVWGLANAMTPFRPYRHRVDIVVEGKVLNWPILLSDLHRQSRSEEILAELEERRDVDADRRAAGRELRGVVPRADGSDPVRALHPALHGEAVGPARRASSRRSGRRGGCGALGRRSVPVPGPLPGLARGSQRLHRPDRRAARSSPRIELRTQTDVTSRRRGHGGEWLADTIVLTCPLDVVLRRALRSSSDWRGIIVRSVHMPHMEYAQGAMVVNYPGVEFPFIRIHETKHASGQQCEGTVLGFEFTGAPTRYYPIETERNRALNVPLPELAAQIGGEKRRSSRAGWPTTSISTWTTACARRSTLRPRCSRAGWADQRLAFGPREDTPPRRCLRSCAAAK